MTKARSTVFLVLLAVLLAVFFFYRTAGTSVEYPVTGEFAGVSLRLDYATTTAARELGLGGRMSVPDGYGMLFVFPKTDFYGFWMKDTLVPLDMFWLDSKGQVLYIAADVATSTYPHVFYPSSPALYVLETAAGFARAHRVTIGTSLILKNFPIVSE